MYSHIYYTILYLSCQYVFTNYFGCGLTFVVLHNSTGSFLCMMTKRTLKQLHAKGAFFKLEFKIFFCVTIAKDPTLAEGAGKSANCGIVCGVYRIYYRFRQSGISSSIRFLFGKVSSGRYSGFLPFVWQAPLHLFREYNEDLASRFFLHRRSGVYSKIGLFVLPRYILPRQTGHGLFRCFLLCCIRWRLYIFLYSSESF